MSQDGNDKIKRVLQKIVNYLITQKKYSEFSNVEIFFVFGSPYKTAMCDWTFGMRIHTNLQGLKKTKLVNDLQSDIRKVTDKVVEQSVCCTDILYSES
jgi:hypothetical protein